MTSVLLCVLSIGATAAFGATPTLLELNLDYPKGGQVFVVGTTQQVRLTPETRLRLFAGRESTAAVNVELSTDGGTTFTSLGAINVGRAPASPLSFTVPNSPSVSCLVRITGNLRGQDTAILSAPFSITSGGAGGITPTESSVGTAALADGSVTNPKLAPLSVTSDKVSSGPASANFVLAADGLGKANWVSLTPPSSLPPSGPAGGGLSGNYPNPTLVLPVAGTTIATRGVVYADGATIAVAGDGKLSLVGGGTGWGFAGSAGTNATVNFIGTTDATDFVVKANSNEVVRATSGGALAFANGAQMLAPRVQNSATLPSGAQRGQLFYDTAANLLAVHDGTEWRPVAPIVSSNNAVPGGITNGVDFLTVTFTKYAANTQVMVDFNATYSGGNGNVVFTLRVDGTNVEIANGGGGGGGGITAGTILLKRIIASLGAGSHTITVRPNQNLTLLGTTNAATLIVQEY